MDPFEITYTTAGGFEVRIASAIFALEPVQAIWKQFGKDKLKATRVILFALNSTDLSINNPFRGYSEIRRPAELRKLYFPNDKITPELMEVKDLVMVFKAIEKNLPQFMRIQTMKAGVGKLEKAVREFETTGADATTLKEYSGVLISLDKNYEALGAAEKEMAEVKKAQMQDVDEQLYND